MAHLLLMRRGLMIIILALLLLSSNNTQRLMGDDKRENQKTLLCYSPAVYRYWILDFIPTKPLSLDILSTENPIYTAVDSSIFDVIIGSILEEDKEELESKGLQLPEKGPPHFLYFYFSDNSGNYFRYDGKTIMAFILISGEFGLDKLKDDSIYELSGDKIEASLNEKLEVVRRLIVNAIYSNVIWVETKALHDKYALNKKWFIDEFLVFTAYVVNINDTSMAETGISQDLFDYLSKNSFDLAIYPEKYKDLGYIELRGEHFSIVFCNSKYEYESEINSEFDMYILLRHIERICKESVDMLEEIEKVPNIKEGKPLSDFEKKWTVVRDIQAFAETSATYIESNRSMFPLKSDDDRRWMMQYRYLDAVSEVEKWIWLTRLRASDCDLKYITEQNLYMLELNRSLLEKTDKMLGLSKCLLALNIGVLLVGIISLIWSHHTQKKQSEEFQRNFERISESIERYIELSGRKRANESRLFQKYLRKKNL